MTILDRIHRLVRANINDLIDRSDVPEAAIDHTLRDMEGSLGEARGQLRTSAREEERLIQQIQALREEALRWEDRAMLALRAQDEPLARQALLKKNDLDHQANHLREQLDRHRDYLADLTGSLDALEHKIDGLRGRRRSIAAAPPAAATPPASYTFPSFSDAPSPPPRRAFAFDEDLRRDHPEDVFGVERPFQAFDAMQERFIQAEARLEADRALSDPLRDDLDDRFKRLEREATTQRGLDALKQGAQPEAGAATTSPDADAIRRKLLEDLEG